MRGRWWWGAWGLCAALAFTGCQKKQAETSSATQEAFLGEPTAVVGSCAGENITLAEVNKVVGIWKGNQMAGIQGTGERDLQKRALESLIEQKVLFGAAKEAGMIPPTEQVDGVMQQLQSRYPSQQEFEGALAQQQLTLAELRQSVLTDMAIRQYLSQTLPDTVRVTPDDCRAYYDQHPELFEQVHASHILLRVDPAASPEAKERLRHRADSLLAAVRQGADFAEAARKMSEDPYSAEKGGDLGFFGHGQMVPPFEEAAYKLAAGQVSDVVETQYGFHIIRVEEKRQAPYDPNMEGMLTQNLLSQRRSDVVRKRVEELKGHQSIDRKL
jgi:peptidyl-prolyl cis-trans isomerase C